MLIRWMKYLLCLHAEPNVENNIWIVIDFLRTRELSIVIPVKTGIQTIDVKWIPTFSQRDAYGSGNDKTIF